MRPIVAWYVAESASDRAMAGSQPDSHTTRMASQLNSTARYIMSQAFAPSTTITYQRAASLYQIFCTKTGKALPGYPLSSKMLFSSSHFYFNVNGSQIPFRRIWQPLLQLINCTEGWTILDHLLLRNCLRMCTRFGVVLTCACQFKLIYCTHLLIPRRTSCKQYICRLC